MSATVDLDQAHRLREAETEWLRRSAERLRARRTTVAPRPRPIAEEGR